MALLRTRTRPDTDPPAGAPCIPQKRQRRARRRAVLGTVALLGTGAGVLSTRALAQASPGGYLSQLQNVVVGASTVPANGDVNPYGVADVTQSTGTLVAGGVLVSNVNDEANAQGTGTTIVEQLPDGTMTPFAQIVQASPTGPCPGCIGLTTALSVLPGGWVVVGSLPTTAGGPADEGTPAGIGAGCLIVLDSSGNLVETWAGGPINGPWDMTAVADGHHAELFVSNVLNGTVAADAGVPADQPGNVVDGGTVVRIGVALSAHHAPVLQSETVVARGFAERTDPDALVVGPTGLAMGQHGALYVADTVNSRIAVVPDALGRSDALGKPGGFTVSEASVLDAPLGMALTPDGDILTVNGGNGQIVETAPWGQTVATATLDDSGPAPGGAGDLFGLAVAPGGRGIWFVDDGTNTLDLFF